MTTGHRLNGSRLVGLLREALGERGVHEDLIHLEKDELLFEEGAPAEKFYVVERGRIRLELSTPGKPTAIVQTIGVGDLVGLSWFNANSRWSWDARAMIETDLREYDASLVRRVCNQDPNLRAEVAGCVANEAIRRLHAARLQLVDLFGGDV
jgi:CRP-like cAMP-binding protein